MDAGVIVTTADELRALVGEIVEPLRAELASARERTQPTEPERLTPEQAARFLTDRGHPTTRATIYDLVYRRAIPHAKVGRRVVLFRRELLEWLEARTVRPEDRRAEATRRIAENANRKTARQ